MTVVGETFVRVRADTTGFKQEAAGPVASAGRDLSKVFLAAFAVGGIAKSIESVVHAATEHQSAFAVLGQTTKNAGASNQLYGQSIEGLLEKEARLKGFSDEDLASSFVRLVSATKDSKQAFDDLGIAENVARARHIDLANAALAISKAEQGSATALQRLGFVVHPVTAAVDALKTKRENATIAGAKFTEQEKQVWQQSLLTAAAQDKEATRLEVLATLRQRFGGDAAKFASTASGQFARLQQDFHQFEVAVGAGLLSSLAGAAEGLGSFFTKAAESERVRADIDALTGDIKTGFTDIKDVGEAVAPVLLTVAAAAKDVVSAIGGPAILTGVVAYKALGLAQKEIAGAEGLFARARAASLGVTLADTSAQGKHTAALVANTSALEAVGSTAAATAVSMEDLTVATTAASVASGRFVAVTNVEAASLRLEAVAAATAATGVEVAGAAAVTAEATGSLVGGFGALALGAAGGPVGLAVIGVAALAGGIAYLATRESETTRTTRQFQDAVADLGGEIRNADQAKLTEQSDKLALAQAKAALATSKLSHSSLEYKQLQNTVAQDQLQVQQAHLATAAAVGTEADGYDKARAKAQALAKAAERSALPAGASRALALHPDALPDLTNQAAAAAHFAAAMDKAVVSAAKQSPLLAHNTQLLADFASETQKIPTDKQLNLIFDNKSLTASLKEALAGLPGAAANDALEAGAKLGGVFGAAFTAAADLQDAVAAAIKEGKAEIAAQKALNAKEDPLKQSIASDKQDLAQLGTDMADAVSQGTQALAAAVDQAKGNLNTIGQDLAQSLAQFIEKPLNDEQAKISAAQNRLSLLGDKTTLQNLRGEVLLPGGKSLSQDPTKAIAQLQALAKTTKSPALQTFIQQYQAAALQEQSDGLATKQAVAQAIEQRASTRLANLTDLFNTGRISQATLEKDVTAIFAKQGLNPKTAKSRGAAFADTVAGQLTGLDHQATAIGQVPQAGSGLVPSIVRPIDTLNATQKQLAGIAKQQRDKQLDETKKQTTLLKTIAGGRAAAKLTGSLDHNPGTKTKQGVDLVGSGG